MQIEVNQFKAIILDLGGVVLNIDYQKTIDAFKRLGHDRFDREYSQIQQSGTFDALETGNISPSEFIEQMQEALPSASSDQIITAWNALLLDFPKGRFDTLKAIRSNQPTFLLSNTNAIHLSAFSKTLQGETGQASLDHFFDKVYLSHEIGLRKPDLAAFQIILDEQNIRPEETLFVDDSPQHVEAAKRLGIQAIHLTNGDTIERLFAPFLA